MVKTDMPPQMRRKRVSELERAQLRVPGSCCIELRVQYLQFRHDLVATMFPVREIFKQEYYWSAPTKRNAVAVTTNTFSGFVSSLMPFCRR